MISMKRNNPIPLIPSLLFMVSGIVVIIYLAISIATVQTTSANLSANPYLNTSHYPVFMPYVQNTNLWLTINGSVYQYWVALDNYQSGAFPCIMKMQAVRNDNATYALTQAEVNATLGSADILLASGNSPKQHEYGTPIILANIHLLLCSNYTR